MNGAWYRASVTAYPNSVNYMLTASVGRYEVKPQMTTDQEKVAPVFDDDCLPFDTYEEPRPSDCECWGQEDLACFSCYMAGFEEPNPDAPKWTGKNNEN